MAALYYIYLLVAARSAKSSTHGSKDPECAWLTTKGSLEAKTIELLTFNRIKLRGYNPELRYLIYFWT